MSKNIFTRSDNIQDNILKNTHTVFSRQDHKQYLQSFIFDVFERIQYQGRVSYKYYDRA